MSENVRYTASREEALAAYRERGADSDLVWKPEPKRFVVQTRGGAIVSGPHSSFTSAELARREFAFAHLFEIREELV